MSMATDTGAYQNGGDPNSNSNTQQRPSHDISAYYKVLGAVVVSLATIALLAKLLHFCLRSLKHAQQADAADRRHGHRRPPPPPSDVELIRRRAPPIVLDRDRAVVLPSPPPQPSAPAAVAVEMVRAMGLPLVCTYRRADDGWPAEEAAACAVCLAELADGEVLRVLPVCMHYFHAACVGEWLRTHDTCPLCRAPLAPPPAAAAAGDAAAVSNHADR